MINPKTTPLFNHLNIPYLSIMEFSPVIFWDVDQSKIDWNVSKRFVMTRAIRYGTADDWRKLKALYGLEGIKTEMLQEIDLDERSLSFLSCVLEVPKEKFRCYTHKQLLPEQSSF